VESASASSSVSSSDDTSSSMESRMVPASTEMTSRPSSLSYSDAAIPTLTAMLLCVLFLFIGDLLGLSWLW